MTERAPMPRRRSVIGGLLAGFATAVGAAPAMASGRGLAGHIGGEVEPEWSARSPLPWAVQEIYATVTGGLLFTAGGLRAGPQGFEIDDRTGIYDPAADLWREGPRLPVALHHPMLVSDGHGRVHLFGGFERSARGDWTSTATHLILDETHGWLEAPSGPMPQALAETVGVRLGEHIHLVSGRRADGGNGQWNDHADVDTHLVFDAREGRWREGAPCPMARNSACGAQIDGQLYLAGGRTVSGGGTGRLDRYDPETERWETLAPIPFSARSGQQVGGGLACGVLEGQLVVFGGEWFGPNRTGGVFAETFIYDPASDRWEQGPDMMTPRHGLAAGTIDGVILAVAGAASVGAGQVTGAVEAFGL